MRYLTGILVAVLLAVVVVPQALASGPAGQGFPLEKGAEWVYKGPVKWIPADSEEVVEKELTWSMKVTETIQRQHVLAAVVEGHPLDLAFYEEGTTQPSAYLIVQVGEEQYYLLAGDRAQDALKRLQDMDDPLTDMVQDVELFLDLPLKPGKVFGEVFQLTRQDGMYFWNVAGEGPASLENIAGVEADSGLAQYELSFLTIADGQQVTFVPGVGFTRYAYNHHGSTSEMDLKLIAYHPAGSARSTTVELTQADSGKSVEVAKGATLAITLEANPTTGYTWEVASGDESILKLAGEPDYKADSDALGAGGMMTLKFQAEAAGTTSLKLVYHRPWEKDQEPEETFEVAVTVK